MNGMRRVVLTVLFCSLQAWHGPQQEALGQTLYPDLILYNGKILSMDDASFASSVGTIAQALAIHGRNVVAIGTDEKIRALRGPETQEMDLRKRTVLPGFIMTHEHPTDWAFAEPEALKRALPENNGFFKVIWLPAVPAAEQFKLVETELQKATTTAKAGQWIEINVNRGSEYEFSEGLIEGFYKQITKAKLDALAPNHPVKVKDGSARAVINSPAIMELKRVHQPHAIFQRANTSFTEIERFESTGVAGTNLRPIEPDIVFRGKTGLLADILKAEMELWVAHGVTTFASSPYTYHNLQALSLLSQRGDMPARFAWGYTGPNFDQDTVRIMVAMLGQGNEFLWNIGMWGGEGGSCRTIDARPEIKARESCSFEPGSLDRVVLERIIREGGRIATMHSQGDRDIDYFMDAIESASTEAGMTLDDIRAKRHAFDHAGGAPRDDQLPRIKNLGMMVGMANTYLWENGRSYNASTIARDYGIEYANWVVPRNSVTKAGIMSTFEIDRPLPHRLFFLIHKGITRHNDKYQRVFGARERTDRIIQIKALTTWGSYYVLREKTLGSLEPGKRADLIVLDRDYLTIAEEDIPNTRVLMATVGGKIIHLTPPVAEEFGMKPVGPSTWPTQPLGKF